MPTRSLPVESRSRRWPSGAGFRRTATQMALSRCAIAHRGADWYFWRGTPAIACVAAQPPCSWHLPEAGQATAGRAQRLKPNGCIDIRLHPVTTTAIRHAQVPAVWYAVDDDCSAGCRHPEPPVLTRRHWPGSRVLGFLCTMQSGIRDGQRCAEIGKLKVMTGAGGGASSGARPGRPGPGRPAAMRAGGAARGRSG